ncbi:hypothetical protein NL676_005964 [Syzygium grande]|nr:hypothetical protein NL676_005964 [Syzygium grande]
MCLIVKEFAKKTGVGDVDDDAGSERGDEVVVPPPHSVGSDAVDEEEEEVRYTTTILHHRAFTEVARSVTVDLTPDCEKEKRRH